MDVLMPQLGETVTEGKITVWFKSVGDTVAPGDNLFEIETDKTSMEVPATSAGVLREIRVRQGEIAPVNAVVAVIGESSTRQAAAPARNYGPAALPNGVRVSPLARRLAFESGIDLTRVKGSGPHGRIHAADLKSAPVAAAAPIDTMRRTIARRLVESVETIPHFYLTIDVDVTRLLSIREGANLALNAKISINDFVIKGFALALQRVPAANAIWTGDSIQRFHNSDVGVAVSIEGGLLTPIIRSAQTKPLAAISTEMQDLAARARARRLQPQEYQGGAASVSNLGMHGIREFSAIINPPQSSILAVGAAQRRPVEGADGAVRFATLMTVTLSCDHRVIDGALGAQLLNAFKGVMETPETLFS